MQTLALLYSASKPWGYVVLTTKGYQAKYLRDALSEWGKAIAPHRKAIGAANLPLSAFAVRVGTQGDKLDQVNVGKAAQKAVTPIRAIIPADLTAEAVEKRFIGSANLRANAERLAMAADWLAAWKRGKADEAPPEPGLPTPGDNNW